MTDFERIVTTMYWIFRSFLFLNFIFVWTSYKLKPWKQPTLADSFRVYGFLRVSHWYMITVVKMQSKQ